MKKAEAEAGVRYLVSEWMKETGVRRSQQEMPDYDHFRAWVYANGQDRFLKFRSVRGAYDDAEAWFDQETGQRWRN